MSAEFNVNSFNANSQKPASDSSVELEDADDLLWELLSLYADGEASPDEAAQVEQMLRHDAEYARAYSFMQQTGSAVRAIVEVEPPAFLRDAILAKTSHRLTFAQRLSAAMTTLRAQLALPPMGRLALAGSSLAACALLLGVYTARPAANKDAASVAAVNAPSAPTIAKATVPPPAVIKNAEAVIRMTAPHSPAAIPTAAVNDAAIAKANSTAVKLASSEIKVDLTSLHSEPSVVAWSAPAVGKTNIAVAPAAITGSAFGKGSRKQSTYNVLQRKSTQPQGEQGLVSDSSANPQNVSPMMDAGVQHRQIAMMPMPPKSDDDLDKDVIANNGDGDTKPMVTVASADTDTPPKGTIVGKLQLSSLPPTARHIQTAADIQRIQEARNMGYTATVIGNIQRRESDLPVISGKF